MDAKDRKVFTIATVPLGPFDGYRHVQCVTDWTNVTVTDWTRKELADRQIAVCDGCGQPIDSRSNLYVIEHSEAYR